MVQHMCCLGVGWAVYAPNTCWNSGPQKGLVRTRKAGHHMCAGVLCVRQALIEQQRAARPCAADGKRAAASSRYRSQSLTSSRAQ
jgi:hypothetical protein